MLPESLAHASEIAAWRALDKGNWFSQYLGWDSSSWSAQSCQAEWCLEMPPLTQVRIGYQDVLQGTSLKHFTNFVFELSFCEWSLVGLWARGLASWTLNSYKIHHLWMFSFFPTPKPPLFSILVSLVTMASSALKGVYVQKQGREGT